MTQANHRANWVLRHPLIRHKQSGVTIFVVMIVVMVITLAAAQLVNRLISDTKTAMWEQDGAVARQAAEAVLRDAEQDILCRRWVVVKDVGGYAQPDLAPTDIRPHCEFNASTGEEIGGTDTGPDPCNRGFLLKPVAATVTVADRAEALDACKIRFGGVTRAPRFADSTGIGVGREPHYSVEVIHVANGQLGQIVPHYRITATGFGRNDQTKITLEVLYRPI